MRPYLVLLVGVLSVTGCKSVRVIEVGPEHYADLSSISERASRQPASVVFRTTPESPVDIKRLDVFGDSLLYGYGGGLVASAPLRDVERIVFRRRVSLVWPAVGALAGGIAMGLWAMSREYGGGDALTSDSFTFLGGFGGGLWVGALVGGILGAAMSPQGVIYRFRSDTADQVSVVIGVSRNTLKNGEPR